MSDAKNSRTSGQKTGAWLVRHALEQMPVSRTFGIPGVHITELYDELNRSPSIQPILVTHELGGAFIADAISRTRPAEIGVLVIVPAAGVTHALSGIGEAFLAGIPMLIVSGGIRTDVPYAYQIHEVDQHAILAPLTKGRWKIEKQKDIVPTLFEAYRLAMSGRPGPVFVEIPVNLLLFKAAIGELPALGNLPAPVVAEDLDQQLDKAVTLLSSATQPGLYLGWGAVDVGNDLIAIANCLGAPVATTLQGLSSYPGDHPLHTGMGFGPAAVPAATRAFEKCDALLAVGVRFAEIPTGSFDCPVPEHLIHIDIDPKVLGRNFPAKVAIAGDARTVIPALRRRLEDAGCQFKERLATVSTRIASDKTAYRKQWLEHQSDRVNPLRLFDALRERLADDAILAVDDGNHTFLAAELFPVHSPRCFISPTDFNAMGYCVPGIIGAKLVNPSRQAVGVVGDGAFLMTGMELLTATTQQAGVVILVCNDGELSQIAQGQVIPYRVKTCTVLGEVRIEGIALATGAEYLVMASDGDIEETLDTAFATAESGRPVVVDVRIDYSKRTRFTQGVVKTQLGRFPLAEKVRFVSRALKRKWLG